MKGSLVHRSVPEEAEDDVVLLAVVDLEPQTRCQREVGSDDCMPPHEVFVGVEEMHGAALTSTATGGFSVEFGHDTLREHPGGEGMSMVPVSSNGVVLVGVNTLESTNGDSFLAGVDMTEPANFALEVNLVGRLLELPNQHHPAVHLKETLVPEFVNELFLPLCVHLKFSQSVLDDLTGGSFSYVGS